MPPLSAVVITFNEERNIERCLRSLQGVADELVVVDSYSTDRTEEICKALGARFIQHAFEGYIAQKNWAAAQAAHPHVLSLDADEELSEPLRQAILRAKADWQADGYTFNRLTNYCGTWIRHSGWYPDRKLRLWDSRLGSWQGEDPHDKYVLRPGCSTQHLPGDLLHYSYHSIAQHVNQIAKFSQIAARERFRKGRRVSIVHLVFHPIFIFFKKYFLKMGMLDGYAGFVIAVLSAYGVFIKDLFLREHWQNQG